MNRAGDAEFLLQDIVTTSMPKEDNPLKRGFIFGFGMILGLWLGAMIAGGLTVLLMIWTGIALQ